jgi:uracil-DNA glycosylase
MHPPPISDVRPGQRALVYGQAPGVREPELGRPFAHTAGRRLFEWFRPIGIVDESMFRATFAMSAVCKCYPGRVAGARGDRVPARDEIANCRPWTDLLVSLLDPALVIPVGGLAIRTWLGRAARLDDVIGTRLVHDGRVVVPLPHPSGVSVWLNDPGRRRLVDRAVGLIGEALPPGSLPSTP